MLNLILGIAIGLFFGVIFAVIVEWGYGRLRPRRVKVEEI